MRFDKKGEIMPSTVRETKSLETARAEELEADLQLLEYRISTISESLEHLIPFIAELRERLQKKR